MIDTAGAALRKSSAGDSSADRSSEGANTIARLDAVIYGGQTGTVVHVCEGVPKGVNEQCGMCCVCVCVYVCVCVCVCVLRTGNGRNTR
jgi:hypothetical protein